MQSADWGWRWATWLSRDAAASVPDTSFGVPKVPPIDPVRIGFVGGGYILSPSDHFFDAQTELIHAFAEEARSCIY